MSLLGLEIEFPIGRCEYLNGIVISENEDTGAITVRCNDDDGGDLWFGYEYQVSVVAF